MSESPSRRRVLRADGRTIHVAPKRGHLLICARGCGCGRDDKGKPAVHIDFHKQEYKRRKIRDRVQLTMSGCIGPCPLLNVALILFDGRRVWFQSINHPSQIMAIYDYIDRMLAADRFLPPTTELADLAFDDYAWPEDAVLAADESSGVPDGAFIDAGSELVDEILLLSHADTDLPTLQRVLDDLPDGFPRVRMASLNRVKSEEHLAAFVDDGGRVARVVIARVHGGPDDLPGWRRLAQYARKTDLRLLLVNAVGPPIPEFVAGSTVPLAVLDRATHSLQAGGVPNVENLARFLADELLVTRFGSVPPVGLPRHGLHHPDLSRVATITEWLDRRDPARPTIGLLFYRAHWLSGNLDFVDALIDAFEAALRQLPTGGRTPLALALMLAAEVVAAEDRRGPTRVLLTDGRANVSLADAEGDPRSQALRAAQVIAAPGASAVGFDTEEGFGRAGLAAEWGADHLPLAGFSADLVRSRVELPLPHGTRR